jgi:hypothetical protein
MHQQFPRPAPRAATFLLPYQRSLSSHRRSPAATVHQLAASPVHEVRDR